MDRVPLQVVPRHGWRRLNGRDTLSVTKRIIRPLAALSSSATSTEWPQSCSATRRIKVGMRTIIVVLRNPLRGGKIDGAMEGVAGGGGYSRPTPLGDFVRA